jgi:hypothetical protein
MAYRGHIENGVVILDEAVDIPEGTMVSVSVLAEPTDTPSGTLYDRLKPFIGKAEGLPPDLARNHDHYLHGRTEK